MPLPTELAKQQKQLEKERVELTDKIKLLSAEKHRLKEEIAKIEAASKGTVTENQKSINEAVRAIDKLKQDIRSELNKLSTQAKTFAQAQTTTEVSSPISEAPTAPEAPKAPGPPPPPSMGPPPPPPLKMANVTKNLGSPPPKPQAKKPEAPSKGDLLSEISKEQN